MITDIYIPGKGLLYSIDPRPKLIMLVVLTILFIAESSITVQASFLAAVFILIVIHLGKGRALVPVKSILPILIITALLTPPFHPSGSSFLSIGNRPLVTDQGLLLTAALILRFTGITASFYLFFSTTKTNDMILAFRSFGMPYNAALTVTISLRYIPDMFAVYSRITDAHKLRTAGIKSLNSEKGFRHRLKNIIPVLTSVLIHAVKSIPSLAMALDSKGLGRSNPRTSCRNLAPWKIIWSQLVFTVALIIILIIISILW